MDLGFLGLDLNTVEVLLLPLDGSGNWMNYSLNFSFYYFPPTKSSSKVTLGCVCWSTAFQGCCTSSAAFAAVAVAKFQVLAQRAPSLQPGEAPQPGLGWQDPLLHLILVAMDPCGAVLHPPCPHPS